MWSGKGGPGANGKGCKSKRQSPYEESEQDWNATAEGAAAVVASAREEVALLRASAPADRWEPFVEDAARRSFAYVLRREAGALAPEELSRWFRELHPSAAGVGHGAWTDAAHRGKRLLRKTAWYVRPPCRCAYEYADTQQEVASEPRFCAALEEVGRRLAEVCGVGASPPNSVNLNFYPPGGGVGWHSDDEPLFDGLRRDTAIISLSLAKGDGEEGLGSRWFEVRLKRPFQGSRRGPKGGQAEEEEVRAVELRHGDLMTMEGLFQLHYLHSAWPGDRDYLREAPGRSAHGERINLTWRWVVQHSPGCPAGVAGDSAPAAWQ